MQTQAEKKGRHGCLTAWLIWIIFGNVVIAVTYLFVRSYLIKYLNFQIPGDVVGLAVFLCLLNVGAGFLLLYWKRIGFWIFIITTFFSVGVSLSYNPNVWQPLLSLLSIPILFAMLQLKRDGKSAWKNLE